MAYVGTPTDLGNVQDNFRSVVLGEAANQGITGETAVADVVVNRANAGMYGGTINGNLLAPHQFQGQVDLSQYSPQQIAQADQAISNAQSGVDVTGGALYYANPGASSASWARNLDNSNSLQIGAHYFTNNTNGTPFQPNNPATLNADGTGVATSTVSGQGGSIDGIGNYDDGQYGGSSGTIVQTDSTDANGNSVVNADPNASNPLGNMGGLSGMISQIPGVGPVLAGLMNGIGSPSSTSLTPAQPASDAVAIATGANEQSQAAQNAASITAKAQTDSTKLATGTASTLFSTGAAGIGDLVSRFGLVTVGLVLLAGGLWIIASEEGAAPSPASVARGVRKFGSTVLA